MDVFTHPWRDTETQILSLSLKTIFLCVECVFVWNPVVPMDLGHTNAHTFCVACVGVACGGQEPSGGNGRARHDLVRRGGWIRR